QVRADALKDPAADHDAGIRDDGVAHAVEQESAGDHRIARANDDGVRELARRQVPRHDGQNHGEPGERDKTFHHRCSPVLYFFVNGPASNRSHVFGSSVTDAGSVSDAIVNVPDRSVSSTFSILGAAPGAATIPISIGSRNGSPVTVWVSATVTRLAEASYC